MLPSHGLLLLTFWWQITPITKSTTPIIIILYNNNGQNHNNNCLQVGYSKLSKAVGGEGCVPGLSLASTRSWPRVNFSSWMNIRSIITISADGPILCSGSTTHTHNPPGQDAFRVITHAHTQPTRSGCIQGHHTHTRQLFHDFFRTHL